jgi:hypothetical protein
MDKHKFTQLCELHNSIVRKRREIAQCRANEARYGIDEYMFEREARIYRRVAAGCRW